MQAIKESSITAFPFGNDIVKLSVPAEFVLPDPAELFCFFGVNDLQKDALAGRSMVPDIDHHFPPDHILVVPENDMVSHGIDQEHE
jgi:hypothetical protein